MPISQETKISEIAATVPASIRVFERYGIDYCCGGNGSFEQACQERGITPEQFLAEVKAVQQQNEAPTPRKWDSATLSELIAHILGKHHSYLRTELPRLSGMLAKVIAAHGENHPSLYPLNEVFAGMQAELEGHMWKEENILFPLIQQIERAVSGSGAVRPGMSIQGPIQVMEMEHDSAGSALQEMRQLTGNYQLPEDGCPTYRALLDGFRTLEADLHEHIHLENNILFPRAIRMEHSTLGQ
ncbi:MAG: iron-sulfur cluster repair di-iron protein [Acidobacteria bacterium]|nr:iron-sulfur cluster repair di-iron protein [Acidobacteriota bacterium]